MLFWEPRNISSETSLWSGKADSIPSEIWEFMLCSWGAGLKIDGTLLVQQSYCHFTGYYTRTCSAEPPSWEPLLPHVYRPDGGHWNSDGIDTGHIPNLLGSGRRSVVKLLMKHDLSSLFLGALFHWRHLNRIPSIRIHTSGVGLHRWPLPVNSTSGACLSYCGTLASLLPSHLAPWNYPVLVVSFTHFSVNGFVKRGCFSIFGVVHWSPSPDRLATWIASQPSKYQLTCLVRENVEVQSKNINK